MDPLSVVFYIALPSAFASFLLEARRKGRATGLCAYTWGYFQGSSGLLLGTLTLLFSLSAAESNGINSTLAVVFVMGAAWATAGYYVIRRRRWAWVVHTIASFNPAWWMINYVYARNRWNEFVTPDKPTAPELSGTPSSETPSPLPATSGFRTRIRRWHWESWCCYGELPRFCSSCLSVPPIMTPAVK